MTVSQKRLIFYMTLDKQGCNLRLVCVAEADNREAVTLVMLL